MLHIIKITVIQALKIPNFFRLSVLYHGDIMTKKHNDVLNVKNVCGDVVQLDLVDTVPLENDMTLYLYGGKGLAGVLKKKDRRIFCVDSLIQGKYATSNQPNDFRINLDAELKKYTSYRLDSLSYAELMRSLPARDPVIRGVYSSIEEYDKHTRMYGMY